MIYQNPNLLYALFAIAIPIFIHLFNFRKHKKIYFSSIRFLKDIKEKNFNKFIEQGFPNKRIEDWKFSDLNQIISTNFENLDFSKKDDQKKISCAVCEKDDLEINSRFCNKCGSIVGT